MKPKTKSEIETMRSEFLDRAMKGTRYPGMSFEEGVGAALEWILGEQTDAELLDD